MAVAQNQCPNCHQFVPAGSHTCPHCGVYLQLPGQDEHEPAHSGPLPQVANTPMPMLVPPPQLPPVALEKSLPDAVKQLDTAATTNITISGVLIAFYAGAIFTSKVIANDTLHALIYSLPVVLLFITIIVSVRVFYPTGYLTDDYPTLLRTKDLRLNYSSLLLEISVATLAISVFVYLLRPS